jgi:uncharacterized protein YbjQ (UPF0145 family)
MKMTTVLRISHVALAIAPMIVLGLIATMVVRDQLHQLGTTMAEQATQKAVKELEHHAENKLANAIVFYNAAASTATNAQAIGATKLSAAIDRLRSQGTTNAQAFSKALEKMGEQVRIMADSRAVLEAAKSLAVDVMFLELAMEEDALPQQKEAVRQFYQQTLQPLWEQEDLSFPGDEWLASLDDIAWYQQYWYLAKNKFPYRENDLLPNSADEAAYSGHHSLLHLQLNDFRQTHGYSNIYLIEPKNHRVLYSIYKRPDFFASLESQAHKGSPLAKVYRVRCSRSLNS